MLVIDRHQLIDNPLQTSANSLNREYSDLIAYIDSIATLEQNYAVDSQEATVSEEIAEIQVIVDRAKEFAAQRQFYQLQNAIFHAWDKIKTFQSARQEAGYYLPIEINNSLKECVSIHQHSLQTGLRSLIDLFDLIKWLSKESHDRNTSRNKDLKKWAESLETFGDYFEDNIYLFGADALERFQAIFFAIIEEFQQKPPISRTRANVRESYRIRIRNAAGFISSLIDYTVAESNAEDREILTAIATANHPAFFEDRSVMGNSNLD
jgi:hypothetical protein